MISIYDKLVENSAERANFTKTSEILIQYFAMRCVGLNWESKSHSSKLERVEQRRQIDTLKNCPDYWIESEILEETETILCELRI